MDMALYALDMIVSNLILLNKPEDAIFQTEKVKYYDGNYRGGYAGAVNLAVRAKEFDKAEFMILVEKYTEIDSPQILETVKLKATLNKMSKRYEESIRNLERLALTSKKLNRKNLLAYSILEMAHIYNRFMPDSEKAENII